MTGAAALWLGVTGTPVHGRSGIYELISCSGSDDLCEILASGQYATVLAGALLFALGFFVIWRYEGAHGGASSWPGQPVRAKEGTIPFLHADSPRSIASRHGVSENAAPAAYVLDCRS